MAREGVSASGSTPIVVFAHSAVVENSEWAGVPMMAPGAVITEGFVSVLNGHIHQVMQKVEGHITFHTAMSTAPSRSRRLGPRRPRDR